MKERPYDTPDAVAQALARYIPHGVTSILDPSVGTGALLKASLSLFKTNGTRICCVDSDSKAVSNVRKWLKLSLYDNAMCVRSDFLNWRRQRDQVFDCVLMNPPFSARRSQWRHVHISDNRYKPFVTQRLMPVEDAFVCRAIDLLADGGRLLAILPSSTMASETSQWLRKFLLQAGAIRVVHELPLRSFPNIESRMYLLVFDKGKCSNSLKLLNHNLHRPKSIHITLRQQQNLKRFDFGYHQAAARIKKLTKQERLNWRALEEVAFVLRGDVQSPISGCAAIHTVDRIRGFWQRGEHHTQPAPKGDHLLIQPGDLLMARVGRNCCRSIGSSVSVEGLACSDCMLIIKPKNYDFSMPLLFALSVLFELDSTKRFMERGTGASYIGQGSLLQLLVPTHLDQTLADAYFCFVKAQGLRCSTQVQKAVAEAHVRIQCHSTMI